MAESGDDATRMEMMADWLATHAPGASAPQPASSDASFRRYFRIECEGASRIVMDAPPEHEDSGPFVRVAAWLEACDLPAPRVLISDLERGFLLLDDQGPTTMLDALGTGDGSALYGQALALLLRLQAADCERPLVVPDYDATLLNREMDLFRDWYLQRHLAVAWTADDDEQWSLLKESLIADIATHPTGLVHRDFHSRNLMLRPDGELAMLDFQDAVRGSLFYDLISLLRDCYWALPSADYRHWLESYHAQAVEKGWLPGEMSREQFSRHCDRMAVQRHLKAAGIFARLWHRDGKPGYLNDIPRTLGYVAEVAARDPALPWLAQGLQRWGAGPA